jgi:hypothetical protein
LNWAEAVSRTAEFPWIILILVLIVILSWVLADWRAALLSIISLVGMWALGAWLGPVIARLMQYRRKRSGGKRRKIGIRGQGLGISKCFILCPP